MKIKQVTKNFLKVLEDNESLAKKLAKKLMSDADGAGWHDVSSVVGDFLEEFRDDHGDEAADSLSGQLDDFIDNAMRDEFSLRQAIEEALNAGEEEEDDYTADDDADEALTPEKEKRWQQIQDKIQALRLKKGTPAGLGKDRERALQAEIDRLEKEKERLHHESIDKAHLDKVYDEILKDFKAKITKLKKYVDSIEGRTSRSSVDDLINGVADNLEKFAQEIRNT